MDDTMNAIVYRTDTVVLSGRTVPSHAHRHDLRSGARAFEGILTGSIAATASLLKFMTAYLES